MRALITGGAGCLGRALCGELTARGVSVRLFDRRPPTDFGGGAELVRGDVTHASEIDAAIAGCDVVYNLVALQPCSRADDQFWRVNVDGTQHLLDAARRHRVGHVVHLSSSIVYGVPGRLPFHEDDPVAPIGRYGESKVEAERRCQLARRAGLSVSVIRPRVIMGPGRLGLMSILFDWVRAGKRIYMIGRGDNRFQMIAAADLARACLAAAERRANDTFNVGSDAVQPVGEVIAALARHAGTGARPTPLPALLARVPLRLLDRAGLAPLTAEHYLFADKNFVLDTRRAKRVLGWRPLHSDTEALLAAYDWYRDHDARLPRDFAPDRPAVGALGLLRMMS